MTPQVFKAVVFKVCSQVPLRQVCDTHRALAADTGSRRVFNLQSLCSGTSEGHTALMPCTCGKVSLWQVREKIPVAGRHAPWVTGAQGPGLGVRSGRWTWRPPAASEPGAGHRHEEKWRAGLPVTVHASQREAQGPAFLPNPSSCSQGFPRAEGPAARPPPPRCGCSSGAWR